MAKTSFKITGVNDFKRWLQQAPRKAEDALMRGGTEWAKRTMAVSKDGGEGFTAPIVPVLTGNLMSSGHVLDPTKSGKKITIVLAYGGSARAYALEVHEVKANRKRPHSGPGYLREPFNYMKKKIPEIIGAEVKAAFK